MSDRTKTAARPLGIRLAWKSILPTALFFVASGFAAEAGVLTMTCKLQSHVELGSSPLPQSFFRVNGAAIDVAHSSFELRGANAAGNAQEEIYSFKETDDKKCPRPQVQALAGGDIAGAQQCGGVTAFSYFNATRTFMLSQIFIGGGAIVIYDCR
jgi:hypothetical protein